ncbi:MAG: glycosyltransferase family 39 protein [Planctomycetota bacterium]
MDPDSRSGTISWRAFALLFAFALVVRVIALAEFAANDPYFDAPVVDELTNYQMAVRAANGELVPERPFWKPPFYPFVLALLMQPNAPTDSSYGPEQPSAWRLKLPMAILDALTAALIACLGARCWNRRAGHLAGAIYALSFTPVFYCAQLLDTPLYTFLCVANVLALARARASPRARAWFFAGVLLGAASITRATALLFAPIALALIPRWRAAPRAAALRAGLFAVGCAVCVLPVTWLNWRSARDWVLISSNGGINFYIGNRAGGGPGADGLTSVNAGPRWNELLALVEKRGEFLPASTKSRRYYELARQEIFADPWHFARRLGVKLFALFDGVEIPNNKNFVEERAHSWVLRLLPGRTGFILPLGVLGLIVLWRRLRERQLLAGFLAAQAIGIVAYFVAGRYRVPLLALSCIPLAALCDALRTGGLSHRVRIAVIVAAVALLVLFNGDWLGHGERFRNYCVDPLALGAAREARGDPQAAEQLYLLALELDPEYPEAEHNLAHFEIRDGNLVGAEARLRRALAHSPWFAEGWNTLGFVLTIRARQGSGAEQQALHREARTMFHRAIQAEPTYAKPYANLGQLYELENRLQDARTQYQLARNYAPIVAQYWLLDARAAAKLNKKRQAQQLLDQLDAQRLVLKPEDLQLRASIEKSIAELVD